MTAGERTINPPTYLYIHTVTTDVHCRVLIRTEETPIYDAGYDDKTHNRVALRVHSFINQSSDFGSMTFVHKHHTASVCLRSSMALQRSVGMYP